MPYIQNTPEDVKEMLAKIGKKTLDELFVTIPEPLRLKDYLNLPKPLAELELLNLLKRIDAKNASPSKFASFLGAGAYNHYIPAVVEQLAARGEFYTAYTPYQPEASQGMLQAFFEYQTVMCELTGMDISNASHYDGATSLAEALIMATANTSRNKVIMSSAVHPEYRKVCMTYIKNLDLEIHEAPHANGVTDMAKLAEMVEKLEPACVVFQQPNFFGCIEEAQEMEKLIHSKGGLLVAVVDPVSLGVIAPPGEYKADIAVGEGQGLGNDLFFGGPYLGFMTCTTALLRRMPGRLVGQSVDKQGRRAFTLTLQTREQHIRREKAFSNICSNQGLCALKATFHLVALGKRGIIKVAELCCQKAHYLHENICKIKGFEPAFKAPFFKEFTLKCPKPAGAVNAILLENDIIGGYDLSKDYPKETNSMVLCATEMNTKEQMDLLCSVLSKQVAPR